jgi:hypothetical protein
MNTIGSKRGEKVDPAPRLASCPASASRIESAIKPTFCRTRIEESMLRLSTGMCWQQTEEGREDLEKGTVGS